MWLKPKPAVASNLMKVYSSGATLHCEHCWSILPALTGGEAIISVANMLGWPLSICVRTTPGCLRSESNSNLIGFDRQRSAHSVHLAGTWLEQFVFFGTARIPGGFDSASFRKLSSDILIPVDVTWQQETDAAEEGWVHCGFISYRIT